MKSILVFIFCLLSLGSCEKIKFEVQPLARFEYEFVNDYVISFTNKSSYYETCFWDFGDGSTSTERSPTHKYQKKGNYDVWLIVKDKKDRTSKFPKMIYI